MKITGKYSIDASRELIWKMIIDPKVLEKITPGVKTLEPKGEDTYKAMSEVKVGPVRGDFEGDLSLEHKVEGESCVVLLDQKSKMGNAKAEIGLKLISLGDNKAEIQYTGEAKMSGMLARMGQRIMSGVVSTLSKQFFKALEEEIENAK